jgi:hypothetical protein
MRCDLFTSPVIFVFAVAASDHAYPKDDVSKGAVVLADVTNTTSEAICVQDY